MARVDPYAAEGGAGYLAGRRKRGSPPANAASKCTKPKRRGNFTFVKELNMDKPPIVCLCGSTRFTSEMLIKQWEFTKYGFIVLSWCALPDSYFTGEEKAHVGDQEGVKEIVDEVHLRKIDLADQIFVINVDGYIGESTRNEIEYAKVHGKRIRYLEPI